MAHERNDARDGEARDREASAGETRDRDQEELAAEDQQAEDPAGAPTADGGLNGREEHEEFVLLVINTQRRLYAYILSLVLDRERAHDILQQTNLVLLEKEASFERGTEFFAWSARVAYYEVLADRRRRSRDRHLFSDELLAVVASESSRAVASLEDRSDALKECLEKLTAPHREILMRRYQPAGNVTALAASLGKTPGAVSALLHRLRSSLVDCVERKLKRASSS